jgi:hypothetical protein
MTLFQQIDRMKYIHYLVRAEATGDPDSFAKKLNLSRRQLYNLLGEFSDFGAEIKYSRIRQTFYSVSPFILKIDVKIKELDDTECETTNGGVNLNIINTAMLFRAIKLHGDIPHLHL